MSQIKLLHSGGNGVLLSAPTNNPASDVTFKLPQADGSSGHFLKTDGSGQLSFAGITIPSSGLVQTKFTSANLLSSTTSISTSYTNILSLAITPASSSNKICVFSSCQAYIANTGGNLYALPQATRLLRREIGGSSTSLVEDSVLSQRDNYNGTKYQEGVSSLAFQDSPSTTSEITYYLDYKRNSNANSGNVGQAMMLIFEVGV